MRRTGTARRLIATLAGLLLSPVTGLAAAPGAAANEDGGSFCTRAATNELLAYSRIVRLHHSGSANGTLTGNRLVLGKQDGQWTQLAEAPVPGGIATGT